MSQEIARIVETLEQIGTRIERITIPLPPSVNRCYRSYRGRTILSDHYRRWLADADASSMMSGKRVDPFTGPVIVSLIVRPCPGWRASRDMDNLLKPVQDWLVRSGIIKNDNCRKVPASLSLYLSHQSATEAEIEVLLAQVPGEISSPKSANGLATKRRSSSSRRDSKRYRYKSR